MKKFLALLLAFVMVFALAACGTPAPAESEAPASEAGASLGSDAGSPQAARANIMQSASKSAKNFFIFLAPLFMVLPQRLSY